MGHPVRLTVVSSGGEAEVLCAMLRTEGIACFDRPTDYSAGGMGGAPGSRGAWREILVDADGIERARELLVTVVPLEAECVECGRPIGDGGRWYSDGAGLLVPYCAGCAEGELGPE
jgi:hypothetical protein